MPHPKLENAIRMATTAKALPDPDAAADRILAWLNQSELGEFAAKDREEQLLRILGTMKGYDGALPPSGLEDLT